MNSVYSAARNHNFGHHWARNKGNTHERKWPCSHRGCQEYSSLLHHVVLPEPDIFGQKFEEETLVEVIPHPIVKSANEVDILVCQHIFTSRHRSWFPSYSIFRVREEPLLFAAYKLPHAVGYLRDAIPRVIWSGRLIRPWSCETRMLPRRSLPDGLQSPHVTTRSPLRGPLVRSRSINCVARPRRR